MPHAPVGEKKNFGKYDDKKQGLLIYSYDVLLFIEPVPPKILTDVV
jgi:hypothetical protein